MKLRSVISRIPLGLVTPLLTVFAAPVELACSCCSDHICNDVRPELRVILGAELDEASVSTSGACTQVERDAVKSGGDRIWRGTMTASDQPCVVTVTLDGTVTEQ